MKERRNESRYLCADLVRIEWQASGEDFRSEGALLEDISAFGGCVQVDHPIPLGATMLLWIRDTVFAGHVCFCVFRDYGYFVGMQFSKDTKWNSETVVPNHLTNLEELVENAAGN
jgi:hypothetical protein